MGRDPRRRQQAAARKKARREKRRKMRTHLAAPGWGYGLSKSQVRNAPIHECLMTDKLFEIGIGHVVIARRLPTGNIAIGYFMVDAQCLGVKGAGFTLQTPSGYDEFVRRLSETDAVRKIEPSYARKLIERSVAYAEAIGLLPHEDYHEASVVFGDIAPNECMEEFTFGLDGKPFYVSGPYDSVEKRKWILATLHAHCGEGGYNFQVIVGENPPPDIFES